MTNFRWGIYYQSPATIGPLEPMEFAYNHTWDFCSHESQINKSSQWRGTGTQKLPGMALARNAICSIGINAYILDGTGQKIPCPSKSGNFFPGFDSVAHSEYDPEITDWINTLLAYKAEGGLIHAMFHLEPSLDNAGQPTAGTSTQYKAAFNHVYPFFHAAGLQLGWDMTSGDWRGGTARDWEPTNYDILSSDFYPTFNNAGDDTLKTMTYGLGDMFTYGAASKPTLPIVVRSTTCKLFTDAQAAVWFADASDTLLALTAPEVWVGWDTDNAGLHAVTTGETHPFTGTTPLVKEAFYSAAADWTPTDNVETITGTKTDADLTLVDKTMDPRSWCYCEDTTLRFDPNVTTTLTMSNKNLMFMDTAHLEMKPANSSVVHTLKFSNVDETLFTGGDPYIITAVTPGADLTQRTMTLQLRAAQPNCNLVGMIGSTVMDKVVLSQFFNGSNANYLNNTPLPGYTGTFPIVSVGTPTAPIGQVRSQNIVLQFPADPGAPGILKMNVPASNQVAYASATVESPAVNDKGLWFMGAAVADLRGTPKLGWGRASASLAVGDTQVTVLNSVTGAAADLTGWVAGDEIVFSPTDYSYYKSEVRTISSISGGNIVHFASHGAGDSHVAATPIDANKNANTEVADATPGLFYDHPLVTVKAGLSFGCEVGNLTRNVRIEGTPPVGTVNHRTHFMFHNTVPVAQTPSYIQLRYMGPREPAVLGEGLERKIVGRWPFHFHKEGNNSRGSVVQSCVVRDSGSHAYVQHAAHGVSIVDCISYHNLEISFWWDANADSDNSDDVLWDHCMVGWQDWKDLRNMGFGFLLSSTVGPVGEAILRDCCAWGIRGGDQSGGAGWNTGIPVATVWDTQGVNVFHNSHYQGFGSWINAPVHRSDHFDFVLYRNGLSGLFPDGAYSTNLSYERTILFENGWDTNGLAQWRSNANSQISPEGKWSIRQYFHVDAGGFTQGMRVDESLSPGGAPTQNIDCHFQNCIAPVLRLDDPRTYLTRHVLAVSGSGLTRTLTLQLNPAETDVRVPVTGDAGSVISVPTDPKSTMRLFHTNFYGSLSNYPNALPGWETLGKVTAIGNPSGGTQQVTVVYLSDPGAPPAAFSIAGPRGTIYASIFPNDSGESQPQRRDYVRCSIRDIGASVDHDVTIADWDLLELRGRSANFTPQGVFQTMIPGTEIRVQNRADTAAFKMHWDMDCRTNAEVLANMVYTDIPPFALAVATQSIPNGTNGAAYTQVQLTANLNDDGVLPITWGLKYDSAALPGNLELTTDGILRTISNAVLAVSPGTYPFTVEVTDARGVTAPKDYGFVVGGVSNFQITTTSVAPGFVGQVYTPVDLVTTGGTGAITWALASGTLPGGITFNAAGRLQGTPNAVGNFNFVVRATDSASHTDTQALTMTVSTTDPVITTTSIPPGVVGVAYNFQQLLATGGVQPYTWSIASGALPDGLSLTVSSGGVGIISGTPTVEMVTTPTFRVTDAQAHSATKTFTMSVVGPVVIPDQTLPIADVGQFYSYQIIVTGGSPPYGFTAINDPDGLNVPPGMALSGDGVVSGVPQTTGPKLFTVQVIDGGSFTTSRLMRLRVQKHLHRPGSGVGVHPTIFEEDGGQ